jgi:hypothetical protein
MAIVRIGQWLAAIDDRLLQLAAQCSSVKQFCVEAEPGAPVRLRLQWTQPDILEGWIQLDGEGDQPGMYCIQGDCLQVCIPADPPAAEAAVRALFQIATLRQGGVLLHAASASFGPSAIVALGPSGAGKSTLARFCLEAGGELLSDETVALYPDGHVYGTPFFSDDDLIGAPRSARATRIVWLQKGDQESIETLSQSQGVAMLLAQAYRPAPSEAAPEALLGRTAQVARTSGLHRLVFRKHPGAGDFVKRCLLAA